MPDVMFLWDGWEPLLRILLVTTLGYVWLVLLVTRSGQRTLSDMTPFDFVITVTLGSAFGRVITATEVSLSEVVLAFAVLVALQWIFALARDRGFRITRLLHAEPALLYHRGEILEAAMRRHRIGEDDLLGAARKNGRGSLAEVDAIVLESNGDFAVIGTANAGDSSALPPR
ncbi:MAG: DUF421 domain-containing protein [Acidimicrobiales bacterium]